jgi:hypothetical protein
MIQPQVVFGISVLPGLRGVGDDRRTIYLDRASGQTTH